MLAIKSKTPVVPVTIFNSHNIMRKHKLEVNPGTIEIMIDKPIPVDEFSGRDGETKLMELTRSVIEKNLKTKIK